MGAGAMLRVMGILPTHSISNCFEMENCPFQFPFYNILVIKGLHQNFNISLPFLQKYKFIIDLDRIRPQFNHNDQDFNVPSIWRNSKRISMTEITAELQRQGSQFHLDKRSLFKKFKVSKIKSSHRGH